MSARRPADHRNLIQAAELMIRSGRVSEAAAALKDVHAAHVRDDQRLPLANLSRRTNLIAHAFRLLAPRVRQEGKAALAPATVPEKSEYAVLLMRAGAIREALTLLETLPENELPQVIFNKAMCLVTRWEYEQTIPLLEKFLIVNQDPYQDTVARMNLAAAHFHAGRLSEGAAYAEAVLRKAIEDKASRLQANALEMLARIAIEDGRLSEAHSYVERALTIFQDSPTFDQLFIRGCELQLQALKSGSLEPLLKYSREAQARGRFENAREADWMILKQRPERKLLAHLYFGTPFEPLRRRIEASVEVRLSPKPFKLGDGGKTLDLPALGTTKPERLLRLLFRDFYRPASTGALFGELFPEEYYDIHSSPHRIRQLAYRLRRELARAGHDIQIHSRANLHHFELGKGARVLVPHAVTAPDSAGAALVQLTSQYAQEGEFTFRAALDKLGIQESTLRRAVQEGLQRGRLEKFGAGSRTVYYIARPA